MASAVTSSVSSSSIIASSPANLSTSPITGVREFYRDKSVLITGGTGFMGKVLVEKLLRSCPDVATLYILMRPKGRLTVDQRRCALLKAKIFDYLKNTQAKQLDKLVVIPGDIMAPDLGLSTSDRELLQREVHVVFHAAATVKFDEALKVSVTMNVRGTQTLLQLAKRMVKLQAFVHVSTAYCNCDRDVIEEIVYPAPLDPKKVMDTLEWMDDDLVNEITPRLLGNRPNTYTFTKALAESLIMKEKGDVPVAIIRPSIVTCAWKEPLPGWVDNFNGPTGMLAGAGKGIIRTMLANTELVADVVPVDVPINLMIVAAWHTVQFKPQNTPVYNCASGSVQPLYWGDVERWGLAELRSNPMVNVVRYPGGSFTKWRTSTAFWTLLCHFVPAYCADALLMMLGRKPILVRVQKKVYKASQCLSYFTTHQWVFKTNNVTTLWHSLSASDQDRFYFNMKDMNWKEYVSIYCDGVRKYIFNEESSKSHSMRHMMRMYYIEQFVKLVAFLLSWKLLAKNSRLLRHLQSTLSALVRRVALVIRHRLTG